MARQSAAAAAARRAAQDAIDDSVTGSARVTRSMGPLQRSDATARHSPCGRPYRMGRHGAARVPGTRGTDSSPTALAAARPEAFWAPCFSPS